VGVRAPKGAPHRDFGDAAGMRPHFDEQTDPGEPGKQPAMQLDHGTCPPWPRSSRPARSLLALALLGCPHQPPVVAVEPPVPGVARPAPHRRVTVCEALDAHATYLAAHPTMPDTPTRWGSRRGRSSPWTAGSQSTNSSRCGSPARSPTHPATPGTEPATHQLREGPSRGCLGGQSVGDGRFQVDDSGRVFDGWWTTEVDGRITHQAHYDSGIQTLGVDWWWRDGVPVLWGWDTFGADGYPATRTEFAQDGRLAWKAWYRPVYDEGRRVTWHRSGASTSVSIAETEEEGQPPRRARAAPHRRCRRPCRALGLREPLTRSRRHLRRLAHPRERRPHLWDPGLVGDDRGAFRYARATVPVPAGVTKVRFPPGWVSIEGAADGAVDLLVQQRRLRSPAGAPIDPCDWTSTGVRLSKAGAEWQLTTFGSVTPRPRPRA
jgi:hypothetical protein